MADDESTTLVLEEGLDEEVPFVAVFTDVQDANFAEMVRATAIEGPEAYQKNLLDADARAAFDQQFIHIISYRGEDRTAFFVQSDLLDVVIGDIYVPYLREVTTSKKDNVPKKFAECTTIEEAKRVIEEELIWRTTLATLRQAEDASLFADQQKMAGWLVLESLPELVWREIVSRSYGRDELVFGFEKGECVLSHSSVSAFEVAWWRSDPFRKSIQQIVTEEADAAALDRAHSKSRLWLLVDLGQQHYHTTVSVMAHFIAKTQSPEVASYFTDGGVAISGTRSIRVIPENLCALMGSDDTQFQQHTRNDGAEVRVSRHAVEYVLQDATSLDGEIFKPLSTAVNETSDNAATK